MWEEKKADKKSMNLSLVKGGIYGVCVGDALGVPVEFKTRKGLEKNPVKGMIGYGTHLQPAGTWSDDSSMLLALADSIGINKGINLQDIMERFLAWQQEGKYSPGGKCFDIGGVVRTALGNFKAGEQPIFCGDEAERSNGNGSLMRILPMAYVLYASYGGGFDFT